MNNKPKSMQLSDMWITHNETSDFYHYNQDDDYYTLDSLEGPDGKAIIAPDNIQITTDKDQLQNAGKSKVNTKDVGMFSTDLNMEFVYGKKVDELSYKKYDNIIANVDPSKPLITSVAQLRNMEKGFKSSY